MKTMNICGHTFVRERLNTLATSSRMPQSYLFSGPRQLGKFLVAFEFARKLAGGDAATSVAEDDIFIIGRSQESASAPSPASLSVAEIRQAEVFLSRFPGGGRYRVVIIDGAERLTHAAENALLKMLEEPNSTSVIILVTHLPGRLLSTVRSRLFGVIFDPLSTEELRAYFTGAEVPDFFYSLGLPGLIALAIEHPEAFDHLKDHWRKLFQLSRLTWSERFGLAQILANETEDLPGVLEVWIAGLSRQRRAQMMESTDFADFLSVALETLDRVSQREGNSRLLLEKLFAQA